MSNMWEDLWMKKQKKNVEFDFFKPYYIINHDDGTTTESIYDLKALLNHVANNPLANTKKKILGDNHLFHVCKKEKDSNIWEIQILHLREQVLPGIADEDGAYELIKLSEDQYPAESTTILYDEDKCVLYMQRNIYGTSIKALTGLLQLISPEEVFVMLKPMMQYSEIDRVTSAKKHKTLHIAVDRELLIPEKKNTNLGKIITAFSSYEGDIIEIKLGFGRKKGHFLNSTDTIELLKEVYEFPGTNKLKVDILESEDSKIEKVDLLDDRRKFYIEMEYSRENPITHERLYWRCLEEIRKAQN